jgi:hypothetical protein
MADSITVAEGGSEAVLDLPFVMEASDGELCFWSTEASGDRSADIDRGEYYARLTLTVAKDFGVPLLVASILRDMIAAGRFSGVEAGYLAVVASTAQVGALN